MGPMALDGVCDLALASLSDSSVCWMRGSGCLTVDGGGHGSEASHRRKGACVWILREQERQHSPAGAGKPKSDEWRLNRHRIDFRMPPVPCFHLQSLFQTEDALGECGFASSVQASLVSE